MRARQFACDAQAETVPLRLLVASRATNVWVPIAVGVQVESKGVAESVFTPTPSLLNTTLRVLALACAVAV